MNFFSTKFQTFGYRLELIEECKRLKKSGKYLPKDYKKLIFSDPFKYDDFINILCFIDPNSETNLVDIGANVGEFTKDFIKFFPNNKSALLFEPIKKLSEDIKYNLKNVCDYKLFNVGLSDEKGVKILKYQASNTTLASLKSYSRDVNNFYNKKDGIEEKVEIDVLDNYKPYIKNHKNLIIKIDVQGNEFEVIKGGLSLISLSSILILECSFTSEYENEKPSFSECLKLLDKIDMYPIIFQNYSKKISNYPFERDVIFCKKNLLEKIYFKNY
jgi:FkbM family methyltransferase|tara:strand:+ start:109 stop:924 length:816 start_codon:yes stop_codon:yes gene_type:complete